VHINAISRPILGANINSGMTYVTGRHQCVM